MTLHEPVSRLHSEHDRRAATPEPTRSDSALAVAIKGLVVVAVFALGWMMASRQTWEDKVRGYVGAYWMLGTLELRRPGLLEALQEIGGQLDTVTADLKTWRPQAPPRQEADDDQRQGEKVVTPEMQAHDRAVQSVEQLRQVVSRLRSIYRITEVEQAAWERFQNELTKVMDVRRSQPEAQPKPRFDESRTKQPVTEEMKDHDTPDPAPAAPSSDIKQPLPGSDP